jgi:Flp pilus assembly protein TadD
MTVVPMVRPRGEVMPRGKLAALTAFLALIACVDLASCAGTGPRKTMTAEGRLQVAAEAEAAGNSQLAISMYTEAAERDPGNIELQLRCADALARNGRISQARRLLTERLRGSPAQSALIRALALIDLVAGDAAQAIAGLDRLLAIDPGDVRALVDKAVALDLQGQHAAAQAIYHQVLAQTPDDAATRNNLAVSLMLEGRTAQALETLAPMQDADGSSARLKTNLGILYAATGDADRSQQLLGDRVTERELAAVTRALAAAPADTPARQP